MKGEQAMAVDSRLKSAIAGMISLAAVAALAMLALVGGGASQSPAVASAPARAVVWRGLPLGGHWQPTSLTLHVNALITNRQRGLVLAGTSDGLWRSAD